MRPMRPRAINSMFEHAVARPATATELKRFEEGLGEDAGGL